MLKPDISLAAHTERPIITINGVEFSYKVPVRIAEDTDVVVECDAHVGKPPETMYWYIYDNTTSSFVLETTMIGKGMLLYMLLKLPMTHIEFYRYLFFIIIDRMLSCRIRQSN